jgi:hypothetical protein
MKKENTKDIIQIADLLSEESIQALSRVTGKHYSRETIRELIRIERKERSFDFWNKFMREIPGFSRGDDD